MYRHPDGRILVVPQHGTVKRGTLASISEVRVLVASRPHPSIPDDVAEDHLLQTTSPRQLDVSEHARDIERRAKHELKQLLAGEQLQRDVLGLITAAGGGLTLSDLEELIEQPPFEIEVC
ncbi:MAG: hypothetical protein M3291_00630 [Actinomycetota bacterium]|nr:hypothetical protein [Actinomycetota bacterium]